VPEELSLMLRRLIVTKELSITLMYFSIIPLFWMFLRGAWGYLRKYEMFTSIFMMVLLCFPALYLEYGIITAGFLSILLVLTPVHALFGCAFTKRLIWKSVVK
jgi:hypothetical protein